MRKFILPVLLTVLALTLPGAAFSARAQDAPRKHSIIRVITTTDEPDAADSGIEVFVMDLDGALSSSIEFAWLPLRRGYLGVQLLDLTQELRVHFGVPEDAGVMISQIVEDSPAAAAGLEVGDILTAIESDPIGSSSELARKVSEYEDGRAVLLEVWRHRRVKILTATIAERERTALDLARLMPHGAGGLGTAPLLSRFFVRGKDGENLGTGSGRVSEHIIEIDEAGLQEALLDFEKRFANPDFLRKFKMFGRDREDLQQRIGELEQRLKELEKQIDKLPKK
ncbi:MAG: PDZ domain-containing protein [Acidobacteria bacterium]|nr:PDZ domain-containing protein [Acidobacteriota bacterium]